jgi:hypothetical protein
MFSIVRLSAVISNASKMTPSIARLSSSTNNINESQSDYFDIVISGGGMVGTAMAAALGSKD